jgi:RNA polymerase sigma-70 factor, ECF subfamily
MAKRRRAVAVFTPNMSPSTFARGHGHRWNERGDLMPDPHPCREERPDRPLDLPGRSDFEDQSSPAGGPAASRDEARIDLVTLLRRSGDGDEAAFASLYDATASTVYGVTLRVSRSPEIAAEVLQEAYLMAWQQASRFDSTRGSVLGWLCTLAHRRAVDRVRQVARERDREQSYENRRAGTPADETWQEVEKTLDTDEVQAGLGALTALQRQAVALAYYEGCTYQQVAQRLGVPLGTAKARIRDGLKNLRSALGARE